MKILDKIVQTAKEGIGMTNKDMNRKIKVRFPDHTGDSEKTMTIQELKDNYGHCMLIDPMAREQVEILDLTNLDKQINEVIAMPGLRGG